MAGLDLPRSRRASPLPERLGDYRIHRTLGTGGMAMVYLAEHLRSGEQYALKVMAPHLTSHPQAAARFVAEARTVSRIRHPNVIQIFDYGQLSDGTLFQVMELLDGYELTRLMVQQPKLSAWKVQPFVHQICMGLQAAHEQGVVHRDLKPDNVFVLRGEALTLKLLDFGIAKLLDPEEWVNLTVTGTVLGTPLYMAPEQAMGRRELIGPQTDLYALGVIVYTMLCGDPPFFNEAVGPLMMHHVEDPPPPLREREPGVPEAVARLVHRCLEKEPARRPASARQLAVDFAEAVSEAEAAPTVFWRESPSQPEARDTVVDRNAAFGRDEAEERDTLVDRRHRVDHYAPTVRFRDMSRDEVVRLDEGATEPDVALPDTDYEGSLAFEAADHDPSAIAVADPPPPPLVRPRRTARIPRHAWFPLAVIGASLALFFLALILFVYLAWGQSPR
jgi:serine/threonine protein kinase